jgi:predicted AlkP superfamily pyrophosphatase or phosphodiesterase
MVAQVAAHVLACHAPDLLLVHFLATDSFQHLWGPRSPEAYWAIAYVDRLIGQLLGSLPPGALERDTAVVVVSDHGFLPSAHGIRVNARLRRLGLLEADREGHIGRWQARLVMNHGAAWVYLHDTGDRERLGRDLARELAGLPGVARVWTAADYPALGLPAPADNPHAGDLLLEAEPGYAFVDEAGGDDVLGPPRYRGTHGQLPGRPDNLAFFLAAGPGIARGVTLPGLESRDVAPTVAHLLGVDLPPVEGRLLAEALA